MTDDDWAVLPRIGMGRLRFGMSPAQVDALSHIYGALTGRVSDATPEALLRDTLEQFGAAMSEEDKQAMINANAALADSVTEARGEPGLVLTYERDRLAQIMPARGQRPLFLDGEDLLSVDALSALRLLERANGGPGRFAHSTAAFDTLAIMLEGFCVTDDDSGVLILDDTDERYTERTVLLRAEPYLPESEGIRFVVHRMLA